MKYELIIGLEIHVQAKTKSKMFCPCSAKYFQTEPNSHICPVCLGLPGALPVPNIEAIKQCIKLGLGLNCKINKVSKFDRKHYFYPDLAKGYQISQYDVPFAENGYVEIEINGDSRRIKIARAHMEEDTAKSTHEGKYTFIDYNKSGMPLIEIVTEPDFREIKEVNLFAKRLKQIVRYLDISDADMEKGQMRFELNMSLRKPGEKSLPKYKIEVKNIASISVLEKVIKSEYKRQSEILDKGETPVQETRGLVDMTGKTQSQRKKENTNDYRYFPEPDIPPIEFTDKEIDEIKKSLIELPAEKKLRYINDYKLEPDTVDTIILSKNRAFWFEEAIKDIKDIKIIQQIAKWYIGDLFALMKSDKIKLKDLKLKPANFAKLLVLLNEGKLSGTLAKQVLANIYKTNEDAEEYAKENGLIVLNDEAEIQNIAKEVIKNNSKVVNDINKNPNAIKFLFGQVMKETRGKANPKIVEKILNDLLNMSE